MIQSPIIELDLHKYAVREAVARIDKEIRDAGRSVYRIRVIHGFHGGTGIRDAIRREFGYGLEPKILRIVSGENQGITELILREY